MCEWSTPNDHVTSQIDHGFSGVENEYMLIFPGENEYGGKMSM
jgi:hypothetical protein